MGHALRESLERAQSPEVPAPTISNRMILKSITTSLLLLSSFSLDAASAVSATGCSAINTCSRGGASIDGERSKRFRPNLLKQINNRTSQLDRRRRDLNISNNRNESTSGKSISTSTPQKSKKIKMYVTCISIVFSWLSLATLFYAKFYDWPYPQVSDLDVYMNITKCLQSAFSSFDGRG